MIITRDETTLGALPLRWRLPQIAPGLWGVRAHWRLTGRHRRKDRAGLAPVGEYTHLRT